MTARERVKALLPVIQAWTDGKTVQFRNLVGDWEDWKGFQTAPIRDLAAHDVGEWRIKPEPQDYWIHHTTLKALLSQQVTEEAAPALLTREPDYRAGAYFHLREVLPT